MSTHGRQPGKDPTQAEPRGTYRLLAACWLTPISFVELVKNANHNRVWQEYFSIMWSVSVNIFKGTEHTEDEKTWKLGKNQQRPVLGPEGYICPFSWSSTAHWSLLKNGLSGRAAVTKLLLGREAGRNGWAMPNDTRNPKKISVNESCEVMNPHLIQILIHHLESIRLAALTNKLPLQSKRTWMENMDQPPRACS